MRRTQREEDGKNGDRLHAPILKTSSALWGNCRMRSTCPTLTNHNGPTTDYIFFLILLKTKTLAIFSLQIL